MLKSVLSIAAVALVLGLAVPITARGEIVTVAPVAPSTSADTPPPPTVLRGTPPSAIRPVPFPMCPPGSLPSPGVGCIAPTEDEYAEGLPNYDYWPDYWDGYPGYGFPSFGRRAGRFPGSHGFRSFHRTVKFGGFGTSTGHMGGFARK